MQINVEAFKTEASDLRDIEFIKNRDYEKRMSSSLKLGIEKMKGRAQATFIFLRISHLFHILLCNH